MRTLGWFIAFAVIPLIDAHAQSSSTRTVVVLADTRTEIQRYILLEPDCSPLDIKVRVTSAPKKGKLEVEEGMIFPNYAKDNPRAGCNKERVPGASLVFYTPDAGFKGQDKVSVEVFSERGQSYKYNIAITVK